MDGRQWWSHGISINQPPQEIDLLTGIGLPQPRPGGLITN